MNKGLEALKNLKKRMCYQIALEGKTEVQEEWDIIEKELKAIEIIRKKPRLDLVYIRDTEDYDDYIMTLNIVRYGLENEDVLIYATEKEYDLLKEVMFIEEK